MSSTTGFGTGVFGSSPLGTQPFFDTKSLIDNILYATGHSNPANETTKRRAILQFINNRYQQVCVGTQWRWLKAAYDLNLDAPYSTGVVTTVQGTTGVVGVGTAWSSTLVKPKDILFVDGSSVVYHVSTLTSSTGLTLETKFAEDAVAASEYTLARNQYQLPKETDHLISFIIDSDTRMVPVGLTDFRALQASDPTRLGKPQYYTISRRDTDDDSVYIEVFPTPDKRYQCHIDYTVRIAYLTDSADCYPIIPDRYRSVLYYGGLAEFYMFLRDASNSQNAETSFMMFLNQMRNDTQLTDDRFQILQARKYYKTMPSVGRGRGITNIEDFGKEG